VLDGFLESLGSRANIPLAGVSARDVIAYRDSLRAEGRTAITTNGLVFSRLNRVFASAVKLGHITVNPCAAVDRVKDNNEARSLRRAPFTAAEISALVNNAAGDWKGVILLGATSGLRLSDISNLRWESIDLDAALLRLRTRKTDTPIVVPLHPDFLRWLSDGPRGIGKAPVFLELTGITTAGRYGLSNQFREIMRKAGVVGETTARHGVVGRTRRSKTFHSLRHAFVSQLANSGIAPDVRQKLAGHSSAAVHGIYSHHEIETLRKAVETLPRIEEAP
jgi:integrase